MLSGGVCVNPGPTFSVVFAFGGGGIEGRGSPGNTNIIDTVALLGVVVEKKKSAIDLLWNVPIMGHRKKRGSNGNARDHVKRLFYMKLPIETTSKSLPQVDQ